MKDEKYFREKLKKLKSDDSNFGGWITEIDKPFLIQFLQTIKMSDPLLVEIGTFYGGTSTIFLTILDDCKLVAIDNWSVGPFEPFKSLREGFEHYMQCFIEQGRVEIITGDSREVSKNWNRKIDMLFIDGDHSYLGASGDIDSFVPWVKKGGYIFVDDYDIADVRRAVDEKILNNDMFSLIRKPVIGRPSPKDEKLIVFLKR